MLRLHILQFALCSLLFSIAAIAAAQPDASLSAREEQALTAAADRVAPSVVQIRTIGGLDVVDGSLVADGPTTGLVVSPDGYILSSAFNFVQKPASILVTFASGKQTPAELVATDHSRMIVLLKATGVADLPVPVYAPAEEVRVGEWAIAVGRTFRADRTNVTVGIISALNRIYGKVIQTDADCSTTNYGGPLVDIRGRVLGLIVPMSPQTTSEVAGVEWYDSGIGFAVPVGPLTERIERMKKGEDQRAGLLGIGMEPKNSHSAPAELAVVRPDSPAGRAGLKKGDRIVEINGKPVRSQSDLRFALGPAYGGDTIRVVATRGEEKIEREVKLVGELAAFRHAFLGILPRRPPAKPIAKRVGENQATGEAANPTKGGEGDENDKTVPAPSPEGGDRGKEDEPAATDAKRGDQPGVVVRMVYDGSPAAAAGVVPGDRVTKIDETVVESIDDAIQAVNNSAPESNVAVQLLRNGAPLDLKIVAGRLPTNVPTALPPADEEPAQRNPNAGPDAGESKDLTLPEFQHTCRIYIPSTGNPSRLFGVLLWLQPRGESKPDEAIRPWQSICDRDGLIFVLPTPKDADHWERTDLEYLHRLLERVVAQYKVDSHRVVVGGQAEIGSIAWPLGLADRDLVRGIAAVSAPLPRQLRVPPNDPARRLAVYAAIPPTKDTAATMGEGLKGLADAGYNIATSTLATPAGTLSETERDDVARWLDTLDRF